jgi:hypothetical protein
VSRFGEYDGDGEVMYNGGDLWTKRAQLALEGKRGRKALAELRDALMALPEKRLIARALCTVGGAERIRPEVEAGRPIDKWMEPTHFDGSPKDEPLEERLARRQKAIDADVEDFAEVVEEQGEGVCAIGAYVWWQKVKAGMDPAAAFAALPTIADVEGGGDFETANIGKEHGLTYTLAWELASQNDDTWGSLTPERRYVSFLRWIDQQLAKPPLKAPNRRAKAARRAAREARRAQRLAERARASRAREVSAGQLEIPL